MPCVCVRSCNSASVHHDAALERERKKERESEREREREYTRVFLVSTEVQNRCTVQFGKKPHSSLPKGEKEQTLWAAVNMADPGHLCSMLGSQLLDWCSDKSLNRKRGAPTAPRTGCVPLVYCSANASVHEGVVREWQCLSGAPQPRTKMCGLGQSGGGEP